MQVNNCALLPEYIVAKLIATFSFDTCTTSKSSFFNINWVFLCIILILFIILALSYFKKIYEDIKDMTDYVYNCSEGRRFEMKNRNQDGQIGLLKTELIKMTNILKEKVELLNNEKIFLNNTISDISHQIKTPVASANTFVQLLNDDTLSEEERKEYITILQLSLEELTFLVNSLVKMSRLESGIIVLKPQKNSLNDIILQAVKSVYSKAKAKDITIVFDCEQDYILYLDFNWTAEAITNVLDNAVKYTQNGGTVRLNMTEYASYLRLDIIDNGIGIPEEEQAQIFNRFYRGKYSTGVDGVGIGLYLTRDIMTKQKGYIKVISNDTGTTFSLFFRLYVEE